MALNFVGLDSLNEDEVSTLTKYSERFYNKTCRFLDDPLVVFHVKKMKTAGKRCKYSVHGRVDAPSLVAAVEYSDWDLIRTLNKTFQKINNELEHKIKPEGKTNRVSFKKNA